MGSSPNSSAYFRAAASTFGTTTPTCEIIESASGAPPCTMTDTRRGESMTAEARTSTAAAFLDMCPSQVEPSDQRAGSWPALRDDVVRIARGYFEGGGELGV